MNESRREWRTFAGLLAAFVVLYHLPVGSARFQSAVVEALRLARWYAREHVLLCLVPAFFIAGAIGVFIRQDAVIKYLGPSARKWISYAVAAVSGTILAVCSCTVLPLFGGIYFRGAGLGPAIAFLYSGPAINVLAIVLTARVLGWQLGVARVVGAISFSIVIGGLMQVFFRREERGRVGAMKTVSDTEDAAAKRPLWQTAVYFAALVGVLVFANWARPQSSAGVWYAIFRVKWWLTALFAALLAFCLGRFFKVRWGWLALAAVPPLALAVAVPAQPVWAFTAGAVGVAALTFAGGDELCDWREQTWGFAKQILPLLFMGVLAAGFFLGSPESADAGLIPNRWIAALVGDSPRELLRILGRPGDERWPVLNALWPLWTNLFASVAGALMYFATLTEVPILRGLLDSGMGQGPALALLLAGPALSLPNMLVINSILGPRRTLTYVGLVVGMATASGLLFGALVGQ